MSANARNLVLVGLLAFGLGCFTPSLYGYLSILQSSVPSTLTPETSAEEMYHCTSAQDGAVRVQSRCIDASGTVVAILSYDREQPYEVDGTAPVLSLTVSSEGVTRTSVIDPFWSHVTPPYCELTLGEQEGGPAGAVMCVAGEMSGERKVSWAFTLKDPTLVPSVDCETKPISSSGEYPVTVRSQTTCKYYHWPQ